MRYTGVTARGIILPIFKTGDDIIPEIAAGIARASQAEGFRLRDGDIVGVTEALIARTQGNYASCAQIASAVSEKFGTTPDSGSIGVVLPILSRNRFSLLLKAISMAAGKIWVQLSYPSDEVGNRLVELDTFDDSGVNPYADSFDETGFREHFAPEATIHRFTGVDYIEFYKSLNSNIEIVFSNDPCYILKFTKNALACDIHTRARTKKLLQAGGAVVYGLDEILTAPSGDNCGYNEQYGLLGSNKATENSVKLFPRGAEEFAQKLSDTLSEQTGVRIEAMVYGDGGFKDPVGGIWELADPVISPGFTSRLNGTPNELKMKYFADNEFADLRGEELARAMREKIKNKDANLVGDMRSEGTTPRRIPDLLGSLCDLISGSGDRGTPVVLVSGYFDNYASE